MDKPITLVLPWPPSANHHWRFTGAKVLISAAGRRYRKNVEAAVVEQLGIYHEPFAGRLRVVIGASPPDRRQRDLDNLLKSTLDALQHASVYDSDSQIDQLAINRSKVIEGGQLGVLIQPLEEKS